MIYILETIFVLLLLYAGVLSYKFPMDYQTALEYLSPEGKSFGTFLRYPNYSSKLALSTQVMWNLAQKTYGKYLLTFAGVQAVIGVFWHPLAKWLIRVTRWDEAGMVIIVCPIVVFMVLPSVLTEIQLQKTKQLKGHL